MNNKINVMALDEDKGLYETEIKNDESSISKLLNCSKESLSKNKLTLGSSNKDYIVFLVGKFDDHPQMTPDVVDIENHPQMTADVVDIDDSKENHTKGTKTIFVEAKRFVVCNEKNGKLESTTENDMDNVKRNVGLVYREDLLYCCVAIRIRK